MNAKISKASIIGFSFAFFSAVGVARADDASNFRCERIRDVKLAELKAKLVENCDLTKPFSFAQEPSLQTAFTYCCTAKKAQ
jgi:hypothetical protein